MVKKTKRRNSKREQKKYNEKELSRKAWEEAKFKKQASLERKRKNKLKSKDNDLKRKIKYGQTSIPKPVRKTTSGAGNSYFNTKKFQEQTKLTKKFDDMIKSAAKKN